MSTIDYDIDYTIKFTQMGLEDLFWGTGSQEVERFGETFTITDINAGNMPFDASRTLQEVLDDEYPSVEIVGADIASVVTVANDIEAVKTTALIAPAITEITTDPLKTAVLNAGQNATTAQLEAWNSTAAQMTSNSYAVEPEDVFAKIWSSNDDGTFSFTNSADYSALHWAAKSGSAGEGGTAIWGGISGTLSSQTDLQEALNLKSDTTYVDTNKLPKESPEFTGTLKGPNATVENQFRIGTDQYIVYAVDGVDPVNDYLNISNSVLNPILQLGYNAKILKTTDTALLFGNNQVTVSDITQDVGAKVIENMVEITQDDYDALTPVANTVYFIVG